MSKSAVIEEIEKEEIAKHDKQHPDFKVGDSVNVHLRIVEGQRERTQMFNGTVIARKGGGIAETITLHRIAYGEGMELVFFLNSPRIAKIEVTRRGKNRRSKRYDLIGKYGKAAKVKGLMEGRRQKSNNSAKKKAEVEAPAASVVEEEASSGEE